TRDAGALKAISKTENIPIGELLVLLEHEGLIFTTYIYGSMQMAEMLHRFGFIANLPVNIQDYMWGSASSMFGKERKVVFPPSQNKPAGEIDDEGEYEENGESSENGDYANGMEIVEE
ncbi:MAG: hypothetical protein LBD73_04535, partial [Deferribacteraceae bacterium]|nr:hypothetical protein [Deferribacteraceae bacterium]